MKGERRASEVRLLFKCAYNGHNEKRSDEWKRRREEGRVSAIQTDHVKKPDRNKRIEEEL